jgi:RNA polymerase sigma-54 factor
MEKLNIGAGHKQKLTQKLKLSPQMIITAELLQKPIQELELALKEEIRRNPFLQDLSDESVEDISISESETEISDTNLPSDESEDYDLTDQIKDLNKILNDLDDIRNTKFEIEQKNKFISTAGRFEEYEKPQENAWEKFNSQIKELPLNTEEQLFADELLNSIDKNGYLDAKLEELSKSIPLSRAKEIHTMIMKIYPRGIGARNLAECLLAQLDEAQLENETLVAIIKNDLNLLERHRYHEIIKKYKISLEELINIKETISHLDPKPGNRISTKAMSYIVPDIIIKEVDDRLEIIINDSYIPEVAINEKYARLMLSKCRDKKNAVGYIRSKIASAENYVKAVWMRRETLYKITQEIIREQKKFFQQGTKELIPMNYEDVARQIDCDISTVCRVVKNKYVDTTFGIYPMKWFFTSKVGDISSQTIKKGIVKIVNNENKTAPLSDQKIVDLLAQKGISISLRAVTKYRNKMGIPVSRLRKK